MYSQIKRGQCVVIKLAHKHEPKSVTFAKYNAGQPENEIFTNALFLFFLGGTGSLRGSIAGF